MNPLLVNVAIEELPAVIALIKSAFKKRDPAAPAPTNEEVIAAYNAAVISSLTKDEKWLAAHPEK